MTSETVRPPAAKTSSISRRSSKVSDSCAATRLRSSSSLIGWRPAVGSPPSSRTTPLVDLDSSQITGRNADATQSRGGANSAALASVRCSTRRLGASSPITRVTNEMASVTPTTPTTPASVGPQPWSTRKVFTSSEIVTAPKALESRAVEVTPIWTAPRNRFGSAVSFATTAPRRPDSASARTWPSRSDTSEISAATNSASIRINSSTMPMLNSM